MTSGADSSQASALSEAWDIRAVATPLSRIPGIPLYVQIRESLREGINQGLLKRGQRLLSEEELAEQYGVSRVTVRQAIGDLIDDGLLYRTHGVGTFVARTQINRDHTRLTDFLENPLIQDRQAQVQILSKEIVPVVPKVTRSLALQEGDPVVRVESLRSVDGEPITILREYVSRELFPASLENGLNSHSIWALLERNGCKVTHAVERIEARLADRISAPMLQVEEGAPILYKERTIFAGDGTPLEYQECFDRGDKYACTVVLRR